LVATIVLVAASAAFLALRPKAIAVESTTVEIGQLRATVEAQGRFVAKTTRTLAAPLAGLLTPARDANGQPYRRGDRIAKGTLLATLSPAPAPLLDSRTVESTQAQIRAASANVKQATAALRRAELEVESARRDQERISALVARQSAATRELDRANDRVALAESALDGARSAALVARQQVDVLRASMAASESRDNQEAREIRFEAPFDAIVVQTQILDPRVVVPGQVFLELADPSSLEVVADVLSQQSFELNPGQEATLHGWGSQRTLSGKIASIEAVGRTQISSLGVEEERVAVHIAVDPPIDPSVGHGFRTQASLVVYQSEHALIAPLGSLSRTGETWTVFVIDHESLARERPVTLGRREATKVEILAGLTRGERVIVFPGDKVKDGTAISTTTANADAGEPATSR
jgi:HlyD family secretion protein